MGQPAGNAVFPNRTRGHQALIRWLQKDGTRVRVCLEATGLYSLDLALALHAASGIEVAVLNPKVVNRFAATLCRSKTDPADAQVLAEYARRMPKLLHAIFGMFRWQSTYGGSRLLPNIELPGLAVVA